MEIAVAVLVVSLIVMVVGSMMFHPLYCVCEACQREDRKRDARREEWLRIHRR